MCGQCVSHMVHLALSFVLAVCWTWINGGLNTAMPASTDRCKVDSCCLSQGCHWNTLDMAIDCLGGYLDTSHKCKCNASELHTIQQHVIQCTMHVHSHHRAMVNNILFIVQSMFWDMISLKLHVQIMKCRCRNNWGCATHVSSTLWMQNQRVVESQTVQPITHLWSIFNIIFIFGVIFDCKIWKL